MQKRILKVLAMLLVLVMAIGSVPVSAKTVTVNSKAKYEQKASKKKKSTIKFVTTKSGTIVLHSQGGKENNKKLVINAPNANIVNYGTFKSINVADCESFKEKGEGNTIYVKDTDAKIKVCKEIVATIIIQTENIDIQVNENAIVAAICRKADANVNVNAEDGATVGVQATKIADITLSGSASAIFGVENKAEGTKVECDATVYMTTSKDIIVVLGENATGSMIDASNDIINVVIENPANVVYVSMVNGEVVNNAGQGTGTGAAITVEGLAK